MGLDPSIQKRFTVKMDSFTSMEPDQARAYPVASYPSDTTGLTNDRHVHITRGTCCLSTVFSSINSQRRG